MASLGGSIRALEGAAKGIAPTMEAMSSTKKFSEEMTKAATQLESLNGLYQIQLESSKKQAEANESVANNAIQLQQQMESRSEERRVGKENREQRTPKNEKKRTTQR